MQEIVTTQMVLPRAFRLLVALWAGKVSETYYGAGNPPILTYFSYDVVLRGVREIYLFMYSRGNYIFSQDSVCGRLVGRKFNKIIQVNSIL